MTRSMIDPPEKGAIARFAPGFGQRFLLTVDTEEEFDWSAPFTAEGHSVAHVERLGRFQEVCESYRVVPVYLIDWPIANSPEAIDALSGPVRAGKAEIGVQLHPWVNPPFDEEVNRQNSFAGNLSPGLEREKFTRLRDLIEEKFGKAPLIYRAGRYGLGPATADILTDAGIAIDSSVRTNFDYSDTDGPDYRKHPLSPYWVDESHELLELPLTTIYWGMLRKQGDLLHPALARTPKLRGLAAKMGMLERIPLTPEGVTADEAIRGIDIAIDDGLPLMVLSFHSPSLAPGNTPYVRSESDVERLFDWWERIFTYLDMRGIKSTTVAGIMDAVQR